MKWQLFLTILISLLFTISKADTAKYADSETRQELFGAVKDLMKELDHLEHRQNVKIEDLHPAERVIVKPELHKQPRHTLFQFLLAPFRALFHGLTDLTEDLVIGLYNSTLKLLALPFKIGYHLLIRPLGAVITGMVDAVVELLMLPLKMIDGLVRLALKALVAPFRLLIGLIELPFKLAYELLAGIGNAIINLLELPFKIVWNFLQPVVQLLTAPFRAIGSLLDFLGSVVHGFWGLLMGLYTVGLIWLGMTLLFMLPIPLNVLAVGLLLAVVKGIDNMGWVKA